MSVVGRSLGLSVQWRRFGWKALVTATIIVQTACAGGSDGKTGLPTGPDGPGAASTPVGEYALSTIDAQPMPYKMYDAPGYTLEILSGTISIMANGKWVSRLNSRETVDGFASAYNDSTFGTWTGAAGSASLTNQETNVVSSATFTQTEITVTDVDGTTKRKSLYRKT